MLLALLAPAILFLAVLTLYLISTRPVSFQQLYARVDDETTRSLQAFRRAHPVRHLTVDGVAWEYLALGQGDETILFLHGLAGAYDIWWQQIETLCERYRVLSVTYPPVDSLQAQSHGMMAILAQEQVSAVNVVGSSLGGYLAQYLVAKHPGKIKRAILANTLPPNEILARKTRAARLLPVVPEWMILLGLRLNTSRGIYPTSEHSEIVRAYLLEQSYRTMSKAQFIARYRCVIDPFTPPAAQEQGIAILIIEADNDPLIEKTLREMLKATYPSALVHTFHDAGHFPYLNRPQVYARLIERFLTGEIKRKQP